MPGADVKGPAGARDQFPSARGRSTIRPTAGRYILSQPVRPTSSAFAPVVQKEVQPNFASHRRKTRTLVKTQRLILEDLEGAEACLAAQEAVGETVPLFGNVTHLSLGSVLGWALGRGLNTDQAFLGTRLRQMFNPRHLCVKFRIGRFDEQSKRWQRVIGRRGTWETTWKWYNHFGISDAVEALDRLWALDSLTCHGITAERIPAIYAPMHRVFFATQTPPLDAGVAHHNMCAEERAYEISDTISLLGPPDESTFEFVDVGCPACRISGEIGGEQKEVERLVWENIPQTGMKEIIQPQVRFSTACETAECVVCGDR